MIADLKRELEHIAYPDNLVVVVLKRIAELVILSGKRFCRIRNL
jgi:hypothetical protein